MRFRPGVSPEGNAPVPTWVTADSDLAFPRKGLISLGEFYLLLVILGGWSEGSLRRRGPVELNERYYRRRAVEERMAAQRAIGESARAWHAKLAADYAQRASACINASQAAVAG